MTTVLDLPDSISTDSLAMLRTADSQLAIAQANAQFVQRCIEQLYKLGAQDHVDIQTGVITRKGEENG